MAKKPWVRRDGSPGESIHAQMGRLLAANARIQAAATEQAGGEPDVAVVLLKAIIDQLPERVFAKDTQGRFLVANDAVARDRGLERSEEIVGKTDFDLFPADLAQGYFESEQALLSTGEPMIDVEEERLDENGAHRWLLTSKAPMRNDRGEIVGLIGVGRDITERKRIEQDLQAERALFRSMIDVVPDYLFVKDRQSRFIVANRAVAEDLGRKPHDIIGRTDFDLHRKELAAKFFADEQRVIASGEPVIGVEEYVVTVSGDRKWLSTSKLPLRNDRNEIIGVVGVARDITGRKEADARLAESENRWNFALEGAGQGVWDHDLARGTAYFSKTWRQMRGIGLDEKVNGTRASWLARVHPDDRARIEDEIERQNSGELRQNSFEYRERHRDGHYIWILSRGKAVEWNQDGSVARIIGTDTDITSLKLEEARAVEEAAETYRRHLAALTEAHEAAEAAQELAQSLARHDALTGLPNRRVFAEALEAANTRAARNPAVAHAVLMIDLDRFKPINDIHGHQVGDEVLCEAAVRLESVVRKGDVLARLGGDEFAVIFHGSESDGGLAAAAARLADRIIRSVEKPIAIGERNFEIGASVGIAVFPSDGADSETLLRASDMAMYRAKEEGGSTYRLFDGGIEEALRARVALEDDVRRAIIREEIEPYYQPVMLLAENRLVGFEILSRWRHPERGEVEPQTFIPVAEKLGLVSQLTYAILRRGCMDALDWPADISIAINVSPKSLDDPTLPARFLTILSETGFPPTRLEVEVTESGRVHDLPAARSTLLALQNVGIKISLDDFGTGYSSLYNLRELRFDKIKIDRSFVLAMDGNPDSTKIVRSVIDLARSLGLPTIAEGIEHLPAARQIAECGGEYGQGFYFGKAMPARKAAELVRAVSTGGTPATAK